jgi:hypothetical protein
MAASSPARSTPVCPPEMILFSLMRIVRKNPASEVEDRVECGGLSFY